MSNSTYNTSNAEFYLSENFTQEQRKNVKNDLISFLKTKNIQVSSNWVGKWFSNPNLIPDYKKVSSTEIRSKMNEIVLSAIESECRRIKEDMELKYNKVQSLYEFINNQIKVFYEKH